MIGPKRFRRIATLTLLLAALAIPLSAAASFDDGSQQPIRVPGFGETMCAWCNASHGVAPCTVCIITLYFNADNGPGWKADVGEKGDPDGTAGGLEGQ